MLRIGASKKLSHLLRGLPSKVLTDEWLLEADHDNIRTWLAVHGAPEDYWDTLDEDQRRTLLETLDLPPEMGGEGLASLFLQADEAHHSMWGLVFHELQSFFESKPYGAYQKLAAIMNLMFDLPDEEDPTDQPADPTDPTDPTDQPSLHGWVQP